ncbi:glycosyltransferase family 1 protein [Thalassospira sp. MCCC 1A03138]|uniref:glycosyltransferase family 4 protein n=1 Tax=Thalassospira sp. MCCC 1A03138 TaxID=1470576 RepID=UPI000A258F7A|nr:glycosyltransferase family 1 protein [Thalassospira sp. MCCC 1A03138]OSQ31874.1 hypothetical protein TH468_07665 [Thalassospira sp. MCCC 1A03138]
MKIGICLGNFHQDTGGAFTFQNEVFNAIFPFIRDSNHSFFALTENDTILKNNNEKSKEIEHLKIDTSSLDKFKNNLSSYSPLIRRLLRSPGPLQRTALKHELDLLWHVGGGAHEVTDTPYIATVWDLQHRMTPWFPEMSALGTWDAREQSYKYFLQRASFIITGTEVGKQELMQLYGIPAPRVRILPHPTPSFALSSAKQETDIRQKKGISGDYVVYPAQFWPHKNHANLLLALKELRERHETKLQLVLVGSNKGNENYIRQLAEDLGLTSQVVFCGFVSKSELIDLYQNAQMLVYPSICGPENLPPLEAFALGCPVAAADIPGAREQLKDAAIFFDPLAPSDIVKAIHTVYTQKSLALDLKKMGKIRAESWKPHDFCSGIYELIEEFSKIRRNWLR